jgi:Putative Zn-dependent protease, contains TPR repeats
MRIDRLRRYLVQSIILVISIVLNGAPAPCATAEQRREAIKIQAEAHALHVKGDESGALRENEKAIKLLPEDSGLHNFRAWVLGTQARNKEALKEAQLAVQLEPSAASYTLRGNFYRENGDLKKSIEDFNSALKIDSKSFDAYAHRSSSYRLAHQLDKALSDANKAIALDKKRCDGLFKRADVYCDMNQLDKALADYKKSALVEPANPWPKLRVAEMLQRQGKTEEALERVNATIKQFPQFVNALVLRALILDKDPNRDAEAINDLDKAIALQPNFSGHYELRFWRLMRQHEFDRALQDAHKVISLAPNTSGGYALRAHCYNALAQFNLAAADADKASRLSPKLPGIEEFRGQMYKLAGRKAMAEKELESKIGKKGENAKSLIERGDYYLYTLNQHQKALADYKKATLLEPKNPAGWIGIVDVYKSMKRKDDAYKVLNQAIEAAPKAATLYEKRADMRSNFLMDNEALQDIDKAIMLDPKVEYYERRGNILIGMGEFDKALRDSETMIRKFPKDVKGYAMQGNLCLNLEKYPKAIESYSKALSIFPREKQCWQNRAYCYEKLGNRSEALSDYRNLVALEPTNVKWRLQKATLECRIGDKQRAIEDYSAAIAHSKQPVLARIYMDRAKLYDQLGNGGKAAADRKKARSMSKSLYSDFLEKHNK